jgi:hypothetical protein
MKPTAYLVLLPKLRMAELYLHSPIHPHRNNFICIFKLFLHHLTKFVFDVSFEGCNWLIMSFKKYEISPSCWKYKHGERAEFWFTSDKCNLLGICNGVNYAYIWITELCDYQFILPLALLYRRKRLRERRCHELFSELCSYIRLLLSVWVHVGIFCTNSVTSLTKSGKLSSDKWGFWT